MNIVLLFFLIGDLWIETTQQDFADGIYERNIYASHLDGGSVEFAPRFDLNNDGYIDLFTADEDGPYVRIYWGGVSGYSPGNVTIFPSTGAANCDAADLNGDGFADFLVVHQIDPKVSIYWGTPTGPNPSFYFDIPTVQQARQGIFTADFNEDGYLDIATSQTIIPGYGTIFWGSTTGYNINNRTDLPVAFGVHNIEVADFNWDSWLDILFTEYLNPFNKIYWGSSSGFSPSNYTPLAGPESFGASVAELNRDRYLDLIFTAWNAGQSYIYWGNVTGYSLTNMDTLNPGSCYGGSAIADMNEDGFLDILFHTTSGPQLIYWGRASGYSDNDTTYIGFSHISTGGLVADLDYDGNLDFFSNTLSSSSIIFWGPSFNTTTELPVTDDHEAMFREIGNVYNRRYNEFYISSVFDAGDTVNWGTAEWDDSLPTGTSIDFMVRTGNTPLNDSTWSIWFIANNGDSIPDSLNAHYIQYMALLKYENPAFLPCLYEVRISYDTLTGIETYNQPRVPMPVSISPNPFAIKTMISYAVTKPHCAVSIKVFNVTGQCMKTLIDRPHEPGLYTIEWSGNDRLNRQLPEGIYHVVVDIGRHTGEVTTFKVIYLKD